MVHVTDQRGTTQLGIHQDGSQLYCSEDHHSEDVMKRSQRVLCLWIEQLGFRPFQQELAMQGNHHHIHEASTVTHNRLAPTVGGRQRGIDVAQLSDSVGDGLDALGGSALTQFVAMEMARAQKYTELAHGGDESLKGLEAARFPHLAMMLVRLRQSWRVSTGRRNGGVTFWERTTQRWNCGGWCWWR